MGSLRDKPWVKGTSNRHVKGRSDDQLRPDDQPTFALFQRQFSISHAFPPQNCVLSCERH